MNSTEPEGTILATVPEAGASLLEGSGVIIEVSTGIPPFLEIPDLRTLSAAAAADAINQAAAELEIVINITTTFQDTVNPDLIGVVISTSPGAGGQVQDGGTLTLEIGKQAPPPPPPPDG